MSVMLWQGDYRDVFDDIHEQGVDCVMSDPPYSARVHNGHDAGVAFAESAAAPGEAADARRGLSYSAWSPADVRAFVDFWAPRCRGWFVCLSDHSLCADYEAAFKSHGLTTFAPVGILIPGMTVRMAGDGPSSWMLYANVARPKALSKWGTLPGGYTGPPGERVHIGGKPLWLMRQLVRDYTRKGDLVVDPCMGAATTAIAAGIEGRRFVGAEIDPATFAIAEARVAAGYTPTFEAFQ